MRRKLLAGNWKMNGLGESIKEAELLAHATAGNGPELLVCPPATLLHRVSDALMGSNVATGGQDCHDAELGAFTGDVSAEMLADAGAKYVILGHSERRALHGETNDVISRKVQAAWRAGLTAIVCIGETESQREGGLTREIVCTQFRSSIPKGATSDRLVIAYEPVWAIGTGKAASPEEVSNMHTFIRSRCTNAYGLAEGQSFRLLYGGSVNSKNAKTILSDQNVDGALVGGASLRAIDFLAISGAISSDGG